MFKQITILSLLLVMLKAEDLIVSYRGAFIDHKFHNESFMVSRSMIPHENLKATAAFSIPINRSYRSVLDLIRSNQDTIIQELFKNGVLLTDNQQTSNNLSNNKLIITLPAQKISVSIKATLATITVLQ